MRRSIFACRGPAAIAWLLAGFAIANPAAKAQEPLLLRIRPAGEAPADLGGAGTSGEMIAREARARSQAVWDRADRRARIAIASVCTGCIEPAPAPAPPIVRTDAASAAVPSSPFAQTGAP